MNFKINKTSYGSGLNNWTTATGFPNPKIDKEPMLLIDLDGTIFSSYIGKETNSGCLYLIGTPANNAGDPLIIKGIYEKA